MKVQIEKQEKFLMASQCVCQFLPGEKFSRAMFVVTSDEILIFDDSEPTGKKVDLYVYNANFTVALNEVKKVVTYKIYNDKELKKYRRLDIFMKGEKKAKYSVYYLKKFKRNFKKMLKIIKKSHKIKTVKSEYYCYDSI